MSVTNLSKTLRGQTSGWVSISKDYKKIIAKDKSLKELLKKLKKIGNPDGYLMKAAKDYSRYVG